LNKDFLNNSTNRNDFYGSPYINLKRKLSEENIFKINKTIDNKMINDKYKQKLKNFMNDSSSRSITEKESIFNKLISIVLLFINYNI